MRQGNRTMSRCGLAICLLVLAVSVQASDQVGQFYTGAMGTYIDGDRDRNTRDEIAGGQIQFGYALSEYFNVELDGQLLDINGSPGPDLKQEAVSLDLMNVHNRDGAFSPYILGGIGWVNSEFQGGADDDNLQLKAGFGLLSDLFSDRLSLRTEILMRWEDARGGNFRDFIANAGLQYAFGKGRTRTVDSDGDGIEDGADRCPGTPIGAAVDSRGCELDADGDGVVDGQDACPDTARGAKVDNRGCAIDSDGDGVPDGIDRCADTPMGATVDSVGCETDSDGDGVVDRLDRCPGTPAGVATDVRGCEIKAEINLPDVNFETNSDSLLQSGKGTLNDAAATLKKNPSIIVEIGGHTDSAGAAEYNLALSERRAKTVQAYLAGRGVDIKRLKYRGYGETQPIASNETPAGRAENRRVVLRILSR